MQTIVTWRHWLAIQFFSVIDFGGSDALFLGNAKYFDDKEFTEVANRGNYQDIVFRFKSKKEGGAQEPDSDHGDRPAMQEAC
jgi:hypothetical protein